MTDSDKNLVSLREYFEEILRKQADTETAKWAAAHREQIVRNENLILQASEYQRRLDILTGQINTLNQTVSGLTEKEHVNRLLISNLTSSLTWFIRLVVGAAVLGVFSYAMQHFLTK